jgi:putative MATE family efflux protein
MRDLTTGSVTRHLLETAGFMLVTMLFQTLYFLVDLYWVGHLGKEAVAAVGVAGNLTFIVLAVTQVLGVGTTTLISHAVGQRDHDRARLVFNQAQVLSLVMAGVFFVLAAMASGFYSHALGADARTAALAVDYLRWFVPAMALQFGLVSMGAALRGTGNFKPGMIVQSATVVINMILAPFLIFGWVTHRPLGVAGAAIATLIAVAIGTVWLLTYFRPRESFLRFSPADWKPRFDLWGAILRIGLPAGAEFALMAVYLFVIYTLVRPFGSAAQAGFGIGMRVIQAGFMPVVALGFSVAPVAGQNFGAHRADRVRSTMWTGLRICVAVMVAFALLCHIAPAAMIRVFSKDPQVIAVGEEYLRIASWNFIASGVVFVCSSMFQAIGNTIPSLLASLLRLVLAVVPALVLSRIPGFQLHWLWYVGVAAIAIQMVASALLLRRELRKRLAFAPAEGAPVVPSVTSPLGESGEAAT